MIFKFMITVLPVTHPSSPTGSLTASRSSAAGCRAIAWDWMLRKRNSSGWVQLAAWLDAPSTRSSSTATPSFHRLRFVISVPTSILASISMNTWPDWQERAFSTYANSGPSVGRLPSSPHTLWWLVRALVLSRLDYCNGLLGGAPKCLLGPLSGVLRAAARLILLLPRSSSVTDRMRTEFHWLDIPSRVAFKLCVLAYRCIHGSAPSYLARFFTPVSAIAGRSQLRSASTGVLFVPRSHTLTIGPRAFAISAPSAWNRIPVDLRDPSHSLLTFWKKTEDFFVQCACLNQSVNFFN